MAPAEFSLNKKVNIIYQKMHKIFQMLTMITNREMLFQQVINMTHKAKLISKITQCNQEIAADIQLCLVNNNMFYLKMLKISQMLTTITNREMLFQQDTNTILKARLTFRIMLCNQEMENTL
jgi:hypothetical protein